MSFNFSKISYDNGLKIGSDDAPIKIVEYINLRCPDSKAYEENVVPYLNKYIEDGMVQRILKHFDKPTIHLELGNLFNQYLDYSHSDKTYELIQTLFEKQDEWGQNRLTDIPHIASEYGLSLIPPNRKQAHETTEEIKAVGIKRIPTVFVGEEAFVENIKLNEFKSAVERIFL